MPQMDLRNWGKGRPDTPATSPSGPTKEQFEAAAQKVMQTAPPGLSREDFFNLIDRELAPKVSPQFANVPVDEAGKPVEHEPDTWWGGWRKSLKDQILHATVDNPALKDAAAPPTGTGMDMAKKLAMFALPVTGDVAAAGSNSGNFLQDAVERTASASRAAGRDTQGLGGVISFPARTFLKLREATPTKIAAKVADFKGEGGAAPVTAPLSPGSAGSDLYAIAKSNHEPFTPSSGSGGGGTQPGIRPPSSGGAPSPAPNVLDPRISSDATSISRATGRPNAIPGIDPADAVKPGMLDELLSRLGGKGPAESKSVWPPEGGQGDWHSGAEPGSAEARSAQALHRDTGELDALYSRKINDPLAALLMAIGGGGIAAGSQR